MEKIAWIKAIIKELLLLTILLLIVVTIASHPDVVVVLLGLFATIITLSLYVALRADF